MTGRDESTAVLSIRPVYADRILDGSKAIEFRRKPLPDSVKTVLIWRTGSGGGVVAKFRVHHQRTDRAAWWAVEQPDGSVFASSALGISGEDLIAYAGGRDGLLCAIGVRDVERFQKVERFGWAAGPQSWRYAPAGWREVLEVAW